LMLARWADSGRYISRNRSQIPSVVNQCHTLTSLRQFRVAAWVHHQHSRREHDKDCWLQGQRSSDG